MENEWHDFLKSTLESLNVRTVTQSCGAVPKMNCAHDEHVISEVFPPTKRFAPGLAKEQICLRWQKLLESATCVKADVNWNGYSFGLDDEDADLGFTCMFFIQLCIKK